MSEKDPSEQEWDQPWRPEEAEGDWQWNEEDFKAGAHSDEQTPTPQRTWLRRIVLVLVALAMIGNVFAVIPLIYNSNVFQFLKVTRELSRDATIQTYKEAIVIVEAGDRKGTGFNIDEQGLIVTNQHVVGDAVTAVIGFPDDRIYHANVVASDEAADLALLQLQSPPEHALPVLEVDAMSTWEEGMPIYYIGNPLFFNHIVGKGTVLGLIDIGSKPMPVMMIDAPIYKGNSGSPVINHNGEVIAVIYATSEIMRDGRRIDVGLAIPTDHLYFK